MSSNYHTPLDATKYYNKASDVTAPFAELDEAITIISQISVKDKDLLAPPGSPVEGDVYIPKATATGDWAGHEDDIAYYDGSAWVFVTPEAGWKAWVVDESIGYVFITSWVEDTPTPAAHDNPYDIPIMYNGSPTDALVMLRIELVRAVTFPSGLTLSRLGAMTAATTEAIFSLKKDNVEFGTMTFAAAGTTATIVAASETVFAAGDILTLVAPATADATLADLYGMIVGTR